MDVGDQEIRFTPRSLPSPRYGLVRCR